MMGEGLDDNQIFTLTVFLASVFIYNSAAVPTRHDLNGLKYPLTSTSDFGGGEINRGERGVHKLGIFLRKLRGLYR